MKTMNEIEHDGYMVDPATGEVQGRAFTTDAYPNQSFGRDGPVARTAILFSSQEWRGRVRSDAMRKRVLEHCTRLGITSRELQNRVYGACHLLLRNKHRGRGGFNKWNGTIIMACYAACRERQYTSWLRFRKVAAAAGLRVSSSRSMNRGSFVMSTMKLLGRFFGKAPEWRPQAMEMYRAGTTHREIAEKLNVHVSTIINFIKRQGLRRREAPRLRTPEKNRPSMNPHVHEPYHKKPEIRGTTLCPACNQRITNRWYKRHLEREHHVVPEIPGYYQPAIAVTEPAIEYVSIVRGWPAGVKT